MKYICKSVYLYLWEDKAKRPVHGHSKGMETAPRPPELQIYRFSAKNSRGAGGECQPIKPIKPINPFIYSTKKRSDAAHSSCFRIAPGEAAPAS